MTLDMDMLVMYVDYFIKVITNLMNKVMAMLGGKSADETVE